MVFSELTFLTLFLPAVILCYFICPKKFKNLCLLVFSLAFYGFGGQKFLILIVATIVLHYFSALAIGKLKSVGRSKAAFAVTVCAVSLSIGALGLFKYADFFIGNFNALTGESFALLSLTLPIGISFYTFQTLSYTIDVYKGVVEPQKNLINLGTYVAFFPQLIAGPIVQYKSIEKMLENRQINAKQIYSGIKRFICGLAKKVLLANQIGFVFSQVQEMSEMSVLTAWTGIICYAFQIYFDFSGYSDMAIGLGRIFGFEFVENFNFPYISRSITEFWRRWHISLSTWFREYVYIPLGGNRCSTARWILNIFIVWFLTGFWHGANWNFILWGLYFAVILIAEKLLFGGALKRLPKGVGNVYALFLILIGWTLFASNDLIDVASFLSNMFGVGAIGFCDSTALYLLSSNAVLIVFCAVGSTSAVKKLSLRIFSKLNENTVVVIEDIICIITLIVCVAFVAGDSYNPFLYFRF